jgi:PAS domain S-box-containing protein
MVKIAIALTGWFMLGFYLFYAYREYGPDFLEHLSGPDHAAQMVFHVVMFLMPFLTASFAYLMHQKDKLLKKIASERAREEAILKAIGEGVSIQDTSFKVLYQNPAHKKLLGDHSGEYCYKAFQNKEQVCEGCHLAMTFKDGKVHTLERTLRTEKGTLYLEITASPLTDLSGNIIAGIDVVRDITEWRLNEERLLESERKYRELVETANSVILTWDTEGNITFVNDFAEQFFGFSEEELRGRNVVGTIVPPTESSGRDLAQLMKDIQREPDRFRDNENENITRNGTRVWVRWANKAMLDQHGTLTGILSVGYDITARKKAEEALQLTRFSVDHVADAVYWVDAKARFIDVNKTACSMLGYTREELLNLTVFDIDPDLTAGRWADAWEAVKAKGKMTLETRHRTRDGRTLPVEIMANYLSYGGRELDCAFARDISRRKRAEEELFKAQKLESLGILAGGIAHDFNNLLTAILGNISLTRMRMNTEDPLVKLLEEAEKASFHAKDLTQQLLTFARGGAPVKKSESIERVIRDSAALALRGCNIGCDFSFAENLWPVEIDEGQMLQVFNNILINSCQAMPCGGRIRIDAQNAAAEPGDGMPPGGGRYVKISIEDQGTGIPEEHLRNIFDPYFTTKQQGSGLGLAITHSIIKKHHGHIMVRSKPGHGATFVMYLPASGKQHAGTAPAGKEYLAGSGKVLVMDDEDVVRDIMGEILKNLGYEVAFASGGAEAIAQYQAALASSRRFDLVIMDLTVPRGMGGKEAIQRLREIDPQVKAIASSGYSHDPVMAGFREYGFSAAIAKPFNVAALSRTVHEVMTAPEDMPR